MRIGQGYDIHRLKEGRRLVLGGVDIPCEVGLEGHSDADAVMHAVADAVLGATALGDIGEHFPDESPEWDGADSERILAQTLKMARQRRALIPGNVDVNVLAERPKLASYKRQMRRNLARVLGLPAEAVSVKARTGEGLGPVGRGEAIEVFAVIAMKKEGKGRQDG